MSDVSKKTWKRYKQASQRVNEAQNEKQNLKVENQNSSQGLKKVKRSLIFQNGERSELCLFNLTKPKFG